MSSADLAILLQRPPPVQIGVPPPSEELLHVPGKAGPPERRAAPPPGGPRGRFSSFDCVGDMSTVKPRANRACVFRDVCLQPSTREFHFFRDPNATRAPVVFDQRYGHVFGFRHSARRGSEDLLGLNKHVRYKRHVRWSPVGVDGALPSGARWLRRVHLLSAPFVPTNLGHLAWEEAFPLLLAMAQLGVYAEEAVVVRTHACDEAVAGADAPSPSEARLCRKFVNGFMRPLQGGEAAAEASSRSAELTTLSSLAAEHAGSPYVCFERLVGGGYFEMFNSPDHAGKEPFLALYRHRVLRYHGLVPSRPPPLPPPTRHSTLLVHKEGKRGIANHAAVLAFLQAGCDGQCPGLGARSVEFSAMSVREQLALVSSATLAISPPGGVSMILPFLPEGAHAILVNYRLSAKDNRVRTHAGQLKACASCSWTMETELWRHVRWVRKLPYQVWESSDFAGGRVGRDSAVQLKLPRLAYLVRVALDAMAPAAS